MSLQLISPIYPLFDDANRCLLCGHTAIRSKDDVLFCDDCRVASQTIDEPATHLSNAWDEFSALVHEHMMDKDFLSKYDGWDTPTETSDEIISLLTKAVEHKDPILISALAMFLYNRVGINRG